MLDGCWSTSTASMARKRRSDHLLQSYGYDRNIPDMVSPYAYLPMNYIWARCSDPTILKIHRSLKSYGREVSLASEHHR